MKTRSGRSMFTVAMAGLLLAGIITPVLILGGTGASAQTQGQLVELVAAAQNSRAYAHTVVDYASSHGVTVASAQAQLSQGDSLLATAESDAQSNSNIAAGIDSARAAMGDYTDAAASASVALGNAGLTAWVDYAAVAAAIAEVNATVLSVASVVAHACTGTGVTTSNSSAFAQACSQASAQISASKVQLHQAASILSQASGRATIGIEYSQVLSLISNARTDLNAMQSALATIASFTYVERGDAYVKAVIGPLSSRANATISAEQSAKSHLTQFQTAYTTYARSQASAVTTVTSSASTLVTAISQVNTGAVSTSISTAEGTAGRVASNMSELLSLPGISTLANVVADIGACNSASASYEQSLSSADSASKAYPQTQLSSFATYLNNLGQKSTNVGSSGSGYISAYQRVLSDLSVLLYIPGVQAVYNNLASLQVSGSVTGVNAALGQETNAMATVQSDILSFGSAVSSAATSVPVGNTLVSMSSSVSADGATYVNSSGSSALAQVATSVQATASAAESFVASANAGTQSSIGAYASTDASLTSASESLNSKTQSSTIAVTTAVAYLGSDIQWRISEVSSARTYVSQAFGLFSTADVKGGTAVLAQASLKLQAASTLGA